MSFKSISLQDAANLIQSNHKIYIHGGASVPTQLIQAMTARNAELQNVHIYHILTLGSTEETAPYTLPEMVNSFIHHAFFIGPNTRRAVNDGRAYYIPIFLSEVPQFIVSNPMDVSLIHVSSPDDNGFCSLGPSVEVAREAIQGSSTVIAQVNPNVPRAQGYSFIHCSEIDYYVDVNDPLYTVEIPKARETSQKIGKYIADMIEDGSCLQVGIGKIPDAVLSNLHGHKYLGVHSELIGDGIKELVENGVIDNSQKTLNRGKVVTGIAMGSQSLYHWLNNNPIIEMRPSVYTNDIFNISRNKKVAAINQAISIDLKGQVCSDSIGKTFYSGIGGQVDFIRGAARSEGGKPIIALPSTVNIKGEVKSRIVPYLAQGAGVVTSEGDVHLVVTEYGVADLTHKGMGERAKALIQISHPDFRESLERYAHEFGFKI